MSAERMPTVEGEVTTCATCRDRLRGWIKHDHIGGDEYIVNDFGWTHEVHPADNHDGIPAAKQRWSHDAKGLVLRDHNGIVFVPYEMTQGGHWYAVTLHDPKGVYPRTGYNICVPARDVETSEAVVVEGVPTESGHEEDVAPTLPLHRTQATFPAGACSTCDDGGCLDCTDPS